MSSEFPRLLLIRYPEGKHDFRWTGEGRGFWAGTGHGQPGRSIQIPLFSFAECLQPAFFHNGAMVHLRDAIRHHLNVYESVRRYNPRTAGIDKDLTHRMGPMEPVLERLDPLLVTPIRLSRTEFDDLVAFVRDGLLDQKARKESLCSMVPREVPSGFSTMKFESCP